MAPSRSGVDVLDRRALNRATLARQMLLLRHKLSIPAALEHLVGLQAQAPEPPYIALWTRLEGFCFADLSRLLIERKVARAALMRATLHLVTARDVMRLRPPLQPVLDRTLSASHGPHLAGLDLAEVAAAARDILAAGPLTYAALGKALQRRWPERNAEALAAAARNREALVQAPPTLWGGGKAPTVATARDWLGEPLGGETAPGTIVLRYLAAFGPASVADIQTWCGLTRLADSVAGLAGQLRSFRSEAGVELFDAPEAPRPDPDVEAPARLLGGFDGLYLAYAERSRFLDEEDRRRIATSNGIFRPTLLVDGRIEGTWRLETRKRQAWIEMAPFRRLRAHDRHALEGEASALLKAGAADAETHDVRFARPTKRSSA